MSALTLLAAAINDALSATVGYFPFIFVAVAGFIFWAFWRRYVQQAFLAKTEMVLLELRLPREIFKSPKAMELALGVLHQTSPGDWWSMYYDGKVRAMTSLEIVSHGGKVHFYIYVRKGLKNLLESQIYAQYPDIEIHEVPDYVSAIPYGPKDAPYEMMGCEFKLTAKAGDAMPIKTYIDYGLDKDPKEEFKIDPLSQIVEFMGTLGPEENIWFQMMVMAHGIKPPQPGTKNAKSFGDRAKDLVEELSKRKFAKEQQAAGKPVLPFQTQLTETEREVLSAVERKAAKLAFDVGMRAIYIARKEKFSPGNIPGLMSLLRPFGSNTMNSFKPSGAPSFDYPWQDPFGVRARKIKRKLFEEYSKRGFFYDPYVKVPFVLSIEELATIFHFPGASTETPTLGRIESKRGEAPLNLPI
jgi:hypothetical protein